MRILDEKMLKNHGNFKIFVTCEKRYKMEIMTVNEICKKIKAPKEMHKYIGQWLVPKSVLRKLTDISTAADGYAEIKNLLGNDPNGLKMFACMMEAATITYEKYRELGIDEKIFSDTISCFTRFTAEHLASYGKIGFDRGFWTYHQLSCVLFRIGELEYEYRDDERTVHLHIPSGSDISMSKCKSSLKNFKEFTTKYFQNKNYPIVCGSWLVSPALKELLPEDSKIIKFQQCFEIIKWDKAEIEFLQWVYGRKDMAYSDLPETTSLQRKMKAHLINGGAIGSAKGRLIDFK